MQKYFRQQSKWYSFRENKVKKEITRQNSNGNKSAQWTHTGKQLRAISELFRDPNIKTAYIITTLMTYSKEET